MYIIIWEYRPKSEHVTEFEQAYGAEGGWAQFFRHGAGYLGTELYRDPEDNGRYLTIDRWESQAAYSAFSQKWQAEYDALDAQYEALTEHEARIGAFVSTEPPGKIRYYMSQRSA